MKSYHGMKLGELEALVWEDILNEDPLVYGSVKKTIDDFIKAGKFEDARKVIKGRLKKIETYALPGLGEATVISSVNNFWKTRGIVS